MQRNFFLSTLVVLLSIQSEYQIEARGFNGGKDSTNAKDLKEIENKLHEGLKAIKTTEEKMSKMKSEQVRFEKDLATMLKTHPNAPTNMKTMHSDQKEMEDEVSKSQKQAKEYEGKFHKWTKDVKGLQKKPDDMDTYEALKPFIKELDAMADHFKPTTHKFVNQAKRYKDFGQSMLDSGTFDTAVIKRLCELGETIEQMGHKVSDIGDPITMTSERIGDIWQRTNAKDTDTTLSETNKKLTAKGNAVVSDGEKQAQSGTELKKMCKMVEEKAKSHPNKHDTKNDDKIDCLKELAEIAKQIEKLLEPSHDLEKLQHNLETIQDLEEEFEGLVDIPDPEKIPTELLRLAVTIEEIKIEMSDVKDAIKYVEKCDGKVIEELGNKIANLYNRLLKIAQTLKDLSAKLLSNGQYLVAEKKYTLKLKQKYDVIGDRIEHAGNMLLGSTAVIIGSTEEHFVNIGKHLGGEFKQKLGGVGNKIRGTVGPFKMHGEKVRDYGIEIKRLRIDGEEPKKLETKKLEQKNEQEENSKPNDLGISFTLESTKIEEKPESFHSRYSGRRLKLKDADMKKDWTEESVEAEETHKKRHGVKLYFPVNIWKHSENREKLLVHGPREGKQKSNW